MELFLDKSTGRLRALWRLAIQYWAYWELVQILLSLLAVTWLLEGSDGRTASSGPDASVIPYSPVLPLVSAVTSLLAAILTVWLAGRFLDRRPFSAFGFRLGGAGWWLDLLFGMALGALLMTAVFLVELGLGWVTVTGAFETYGTGAPFAVAMLIPTAAFLCIGFYEETIFRGYQLKNAAEGLNYPALGPGGAILLAWLLSSVFFGVLHAGNPNAATLLVTEQSGPELWTGGSFGPEGGLLIPAVMLLGMSLVALWTRLRTGKISLHTPIAESPSRDSQHIPPQRHRA